MGGGQAKQLLHLLGTRMAAGCQRPQILGRYLLARPESVGHVGARHLGWTRCGSDGQLASRRKQSRSLVPACAPRGCSASAARGSQATGSSKATKSRGADPTHPPTPGRERSGQCVGTCAEFPRLTQVFPLLLSMLYDYPTLLPWS